MILVSHCSGRSLYGLGSLTWDPRPAPGAHLSSAWCYRSLFELLQGCCSPAASIDHKLIPSLPWTCLILRILPDALSSLLTLFSPASPFCLLLRGVGGSEGCCLLPGIYPSSPSLPFPRPAEQHVFFRCLAKATSSLGYHPQMRLEPTAASTSTGKLPWPGSNRQPW